MPELKSIEIENECFRNVSELKLIGMKMLKKVLIGDNCFTKKKSDKDKNVYGLYVKSCELLRELKIGRYSFSDYSVCAIENVPSLEVIEMGELNTGSYNFYYASNMELKSDCSVLRMMNRFA